MLLLCFLYFFFFLMIRRPPRSTPLYSSAASDVYKRQAPDGGVQPQGQRGGAFGSAAFPGLGGLAAEVLFDVAEADLDGPAGGVAGGDLVAGGVQVGGEEV